MKKTYTAPSLQIEEIRLQSMLLSASITIDKDSEINDSNVDNFEIQ